MQHRSWQTTVAGVHLDIAAASARGPRSENQDNFLVILPNEAGRGRAWRLQGERIADSPVARWPWNGVRVAILDGLGGHANGRVASESLANALSVLPFQIEPSSLRTEVREVHRALRDILPGPDDHRGGSTLVMLDLNLATGMAVRLHVGDSRGYLWHRRRWHRLTYDHRASEFAWRDGDLSAADYARLHHDIGCRLAQAVGFGSLGAVSRGEHAVNATLRIDLAKDIADSAVDHADAARLRIGHSDHLLLATDGLLGDDGGNRLLAALAGTGTDALAGVVADIAPRADDNLTGLLLTIKSGS